MKIRLLEERDLEAVRFLRNANRECFFDTREIDGEQQRRWFESLSSSRARFYVVEIDGTVVGTLSATDTPDGVEIGNLVLDARHRGRGLMTAAVEELTRTPARYFARVKPGNAASLAVFERAGFTNSYVVLERG